MTTNETLDQQRAWVGEQFDAAIDASGVPSGWFDIYRHDVFWAEDRPEDRELLLGALFPGRCDGYAGQLYVSLKNTDAATDPLAADPLEAASLVRAYWESAGWTVTDLYSPPDPTSPHFLADREDGAFLAFRASEAGMALEVGTACSVNGTVVSWQSNLDKPKESEDGPVGPGGHDPALRYAKDLSADAEDANENTERNEG